MFEIIADKSQEQELISIVNFPSTTPLASTSSEITLKLPEPIKLPELIPVTTSVVESPRVTPTRIQKNLNKRCSKKRIHPVETLTSIIEDRKQLKNKLDEMKMKTKLENIEEEKQERKEIILLEKTYMELLIKGQEKKIIEQDLRNEGLSLSNEIKKYELLIKKKQYENI